MTPPTGSPLPSLPCQTITKKSCAKYVDAQSVNDIAAERGQSPKAIESLLTRAREAFRAAYEPREA